MFFLIRKKKQKDKTLCVENSKQLLQPTAIREAIEI